MGAKIVQAEYNDKKNVLFLSIVETLPILPEALRAEVKGTTLRPKMQKKCVFCPNLIIIDDDKMPKKQKLLPFYFSMLRILITFAAAKL